MNKKPIRPGKIVPVLGGKWTYTTINHIGHEHKNISEEFRSAFLAKQAMREYIRNYNTARRAL